MSAPLVSSLVEEQVAALIQADLAQLAAILPDLPPATLRFLLHTFKWDSQTLLDASR